jgi:voltage-gated potassium channel
MIPGSGARPTQKHFLLSLTAIGAVLAAGATGYTLIEGWTAFDAVYMTATTMSTVGYGETHPLSPAGRVFTLFLIAFGMLAIAGMVAAGSKLILEGQLNEIVGRRKVEREIARLKNHYIVCGYGRMGRIICQEFARKGIPFVVIEKNHEVSRDIEAGILVITGDDSRDEVLLTAGIQRAKGLVSVVSSDAANVYITLTARELAPDIYIVARSGEEGSEKKLLRAGADRVVSPYTIGGGRIAQAILRPAVVDFIELVTRSEHMDLQMEEVEIRGESSLCNVTLPPSIRQKLNIIVVAIKKAGGHMVFNPSSSSVLDQGDRLIVLGGMDNLARLEEIAQGRRRFNAEEES